MVGCWLAGRADVCATARPHLLVAAILSPARRSPAPSHMRAPRCNPSPMCACRWGDPGSQIPVVRFLHGREVPMGE